MLSLILWQDRSAIDREVGRPPRRSASDKPSNARIISVGRHVFANNEERCGEYLIGIVEAPIGIILTIANAILLLFDTWFCKSFTA